MGRVDFGDLKLKLMGSIVAISAIKLLESFMNAANLTDRELGWSVFSSEIKGVKARLGGGSVRRTSAASY
jgi:uncharacterized protein (TIGR00645 family)